MSEDGYPVVKKPSGEQEFKDLNVNLLGFTQIEALQILLMESVVNKEFKGIEIDKS